MLIFLCFFVTGYSQEKSNTTTFDFAKPFLLEIGNEASSGNVTVKFVDRMDVMSQNLNANSTRPTSYYSYILELSDKKEKTTFYLKSYQIGKEEATLYWKGYQLTVVDDNIERLKLNSSQEGRVLKLQVSLKTK